MRPKTAYKTKTNKGDIPSVRREGTKNFRDQLIYKRSFQGLLAYGEAHGKLIPLFAYYDPDLQRCKLCYELVRPGNNAHGETCLINKLDGSYHRVQIGKQTYCHMAKNLQ